MSSIRTTAENFFDACETGSGWEECRTYCHPDATFSGQAEPLAEITTVEAYTEWMRGLYDALPEAGYEIRSFALDEDREHASVYAVFRGRHTGDGGPVPATGKSVESDYVYVMEFEGDRIRHLTKIWNAPFALQQLGWT